MTSSRSEDSLIIIPLLACQTFPFNLSLSIIFHNDIPQKVQTRTCVLHVSGTDFAEREVLREQERKKNRAAASSPSLSDLSSSAQISLSLSPSLFLIFQTSTRFRTKNNDKKDVFSGFIGI